MSKSEDGIFWMYINSHYYWMVDLYEATIDGKKINTGEFGSVMINSGVSVNYIPEKAYEMIFKLIM